MYDYSETIKYWNNAFGKIESYDPATEINVLQLEKGISWVSKGSKNVLDFGCGSGNVIFRCLANGVENICGIDLAEVSIKLAQKVAEVNNLKDKALFINGGIDVLKTIEDNTYDSVILFNILDNISPTDSLKVMRNINRIVKSDGKILVKINPYIGEEERKRYGFKELEENFFLEDSGLFLWNLTNEQFIDTIKPYFSLEEFINVVYKEFGMTNRMFYLKNSK